MSIDKLANVAAGYSRAMDSVAIQMTAPGVANDPALLAQFQVQLMEATNGFQLASRTIQTLHREDQTLADMLRDG